MSEYPSREGEQSDLGPLTPFQVEAARVFFSLPAAGGFLLAGGAALAAQQLTTRPTHNLDLFTTLDGQIQEVLAAFEDACQQRGWTLERSRVSGSFARVIVCRREESVLVDVAVDAPPRHPITRTPLGPALAPQELAGRKLLALFDRAEARDYTDVYTLAGRYGTDQLLRLAADLDPGFDVKILADMLGALARLADEELPGFEDDATELRAFFAVWAEQIRMTPPSAP